MSESINFTKKNSENESLEYGKNESQVKLSIIVPTYNVAPWIERCLLSLINQNINSNSFEVIVVNDESTDESAAIARSLASKFSQIKVIDQKNKGLAGARNTGIKNAVGKYLLFVDSDDYIEPNVLLDMLAFAEDSNLEIAMFSQKMIDLNKKVTYYRVPTSKSEIMLGMEMYSKRPGDSACKYLINTEFLRVNDLYFYENAKFLEDAEWSPRIFSMTQRAAFKDIIFYVYELRPGSLITSKFSFSEKATIGYLDSANHLKKFQKEKALTISQKLFINQAIIKFSVLPISMLASTKNFKSLSNVKNLLTEFGLNKLDLKSVTGFRRIHGLLFNFSPYVLFVYILFFNTLKSIINKVGKY